MPAPYRLHLVYFGQPPGSESAALTLTTTLRECTSAFLARLDAHSAKAARWSRDPLNLAPQGRIALDLAERPSAAELDELSQQTDAALYLSETHWPLPLQLNPEATHPGTLQWCGFRKRKEIEYESSIKHWLKSHTSIAIDTQNTDSYSQHRVLWQRGPALDGIAEETFPLRASQSEAEFFNAVGEPDKLKRHIETLVASSTRFIDFEAMSVIHLTEKRLR
jgi:hypothetical protein